ncbi:uncharacterized protein [Onthophagus taurus]|uniref:uncharacterized protein n=1 Tax=Onthophagus taurus TaxID=166361 RepID=UPI0039BDE2D1
MIYNRNGRNLRTCFRREYEAQRKAPSGSGAKKRRKYLYFDQLLFLANSIENRETPGNVMSPVTTNTDTDIGEVEIMQPDLENPTPNNRNFISSTSKKYKSTKSYEESLLDTLREKKTEEVDEDRYFLLSLLPAFKKFDEEQKFTAKTEIMNVMRRVRLSKNATPVPSAPLRQYFTNFTSGPPEQQVY